MNTKKLNFFKYASVGLLILNIGLVSAFFITKPKHLHGPNLGSPHKSNIKEYFQLSDQQHDSFLKKANSHHEEMSNYITQQKELLKPYLLGVSSSSLPHTEKLDSYMDQELETKKIQSLYHHLLEVKTVLNEDQLPLFDSFLKEKLEIILRRNGNKAHDVSPPRHQGIKKGDHPSSRERKH